ncbi:glycogen-binding domain-containing protein [Limisphaera sp. 4302-co]|uniref:glycogen-binding domain-containing protein n=1 Tax=Limisphaera sp. 4302-co TaxID=3400417 RepID=UPI0021DD55D3|nr:MAG: hypothetical protein KatS3mg132_057 [Limisphaera sp.]
MATKRARKTTAKTARKEPAPAAPVGQTFRFNAPTAMSVLLAGDFTHWQQQAIPMHKGPDGIWTVTVQLPPGTYHYRFIVDGEWRDDPECTLRVPNPFGSENCVIKVS